MHGNHTGLMDSVNFVIICSSTEINTTLVSARDHDPILNW
jgi:hypothetical protein